MTDIKVQFSSKSNNWFTPEKYVELVRTVLLDIELDPASCEEANKVIKAKRFYTEEDDGLSKDWQAKSLFCNPPYGRRYGISNQFWWSQKLIQHFISGDVHEAILLVNASTSEKWFEPLFDYSICFTNHRIKFIGNGNQPTKGNAFIYFGEDRWSFKSVFSQIGTCIERMK